MIDPEEIAKKAVALYPKAVSAMLSGDASFFPYRLACNLKPPNDHTELIRAVDRLRQGSKAKLGYGYSVTYQPRRSHQHGTNDFPDAIYFDSMDDLVRLLRKGSEYRSLMSCVQIIRQELPELESWIDANWKKLILAAEEIPDLVEVTRWLKLHPRPGCFPRELPLPVSSKLVEQYWSLLAAWWDRVLPEETIDFGCDSKNYAQRYGFRWAQPHLLIRLLDQRLKLRLQIPFEELSLPPSELDGWLAAAQRPSSVVIVENKINLLTFPRLADSIALGGLGFGVSTLSQVSWLKEVDIIYWGDLDVEGFQILSLLRSMLPRTKSWLMDLATLQACQHLTVPGNAAQLEPPSHLTSAEREVFCHCRDHNLRLEQERIPQSYVVQQAKASLQPIGDQ